MSTTINHKRKTMTHAFPSTVKLLCGSMRMNAAQDASQHLNNIFHDAGFFTFVDTHDGT